MTGLGPEGAFPDGHHPFHFVDEPLACGETFTAMRAEDFDPEGRFADANPACAMDEADGFDGGPTVLQSVEEFVELVGGHGQERFVIDPGDGGVEFHSPDHATEV